MINYNIPSVVTSVIDKSFLTTEEAQKITPLIAGFSAFGEEDKYYRLATSKEAEYKLGKLDFKKYGLGVLYLRDSLRKTNSAYFKRIMPTDASFANFCIDKDGNEHTYKNIRTKKRLLEMAPFFEVEPIDKNSQEWLDWNNDRIKYNEAVEERESLVLNHLAKGRGEAYNNIYVVYSEAKDYEKMDSNENGETNYKFNFIRADIYEQTPSGFVGIGDPIIFSLIDVDKDSNQPIVDQFVGLELFANIRVKEANEFLTIEINDDYIEEIREYRTIDDLMPNGRLIVPDENNNILEDPIFYEVKIEIDDKGVEKLAPYAVNANENSLSNKLGYNDLINPFAIAPELETEILSINNPNVVLDEGNKIANSKDTTEDMYFPQMGSISTDSSSEQNGLSTEIKIGTTKVFSEDVYYSIAFSAKGSEGSTSTNYTLLGDGTKQIDNSIQISLTEGQITKNVPCNAVAGFSGDEYCVEFEIEIMEIVGDSDTYYQINADYKNADINDPKDMHNYVRIERNAPSTQEVVISFERSSDTDTLIQYQVTSISNNGTRNSVTKDIIIPSGTLNQTINIIDETADEEVQVNITKDIFVRNGEIVIDTVTYITDDPVSDYFYLDGVEAFYKLTYDFTSDELIFEKASFLRHTIYNEIIGKSVKLFNGSNGQNLLDSKGRINLNGNSIPGEAENAVDCLVNFYNKNTVLRELLYPKYDFDYIPDWTDNSRVIKAIDKLTSDVGLTMGIVSLPSGYDPSLTTQGQSDYDVRDRRNLNLNNYNTMLYSSQKNKLHIDPDTNIKIVMPASYYALMAHLTVDRDISITEPVANINKGKLDSQRIELTYEPTSKEIESLRNAQINSIIVEDETYIIDQLTAYKKSSKLSRGNIVKSIHRIRKDLPKLLKPYLQLKATSSIISVSINEVNNYMSKWLVTEDNIYDGIFETVDVQGIFNKDTNRLRISITVNPVGVIEIIDIPIIVV